MNINFIFIILGINILIIFLFKREWLLTKKYFIYLFLGNILLFATAYLFVYFKLGNPKLVVALKMPLLSQLLFIPMIFIYRKLYHKDPADTFWSMDKGLIKDGIFNFVFVFVGMVIPAVIVFEQII